MRHILSRYCDLAPSRLPIAETRFGKPYLESPFLTIRFNLSHTHDWALLAVSRHAEIGVDVEEHSPSLDTKLLAEWLHPEEKQDLEVMSHEKRGIAFFRLWCRKEALLKAKGIGLRAPLHQFRVSTSPDTAKVLSWPGEDPNWHLYDLIADEQHSAALALDRPAKSIAYKELQ
jgi:4'-phosphopantetheinyl transferase